MPFPLAIQKLERIDFLYDFERKKRIVQTAVHVRVDVRNFCFRVNGDFGRL